MEKISRIKTRLFEVPLPEALVDAKGSARNKLDILGFKCAVDLVKTRMGDSLLKDCPFQAFLAKPEV